MTDFDYRQYSLEQLSNWVHDAMSASEATPQEIYDTIRKVVEENYYTYKQQTSQAYELLALLNGNKDKVNRWVLPVEVDGLTGECYFNLPDDLLEAANLKEGDTLEYIPRNDGSFELRKSLGMDEC